MRLKILHLFQRPRLEWHLPVGRIADTAGSALLAWRQRCGAAITRRASIRISEVAVIGNGIGPMSLDVRLSIRKTWTRPLSRFNLGHGFFAWNATTGALLRCRLLGNCYKRCDQHHTHDELRQTHSANTCFAVHEIKSSHAHSSGLFDDYPGSGYLRSGFGG